MNSRKGFPIPQQDVIQTGDSWYPLTPQKLVLSRSTFNPAEGNQMGRSNWQELLGIYGGLLQEETKSNGVLPNCPPQGIMSPAVCRQDTVNGAFVDYRNLNFNAGSYTESCASTTPFRCTGSLTQPWSANKIFHTPSSKGAPERHCFISSEPSICHSYSQIEGNCSGNTSAESILLEQDNSSDSIQRINCYNISQAPRDGFIVPYGPNYNLNLPPSPESAQALATSCFEVAPVTPDQGKQFQNPQLSSFQCFLSDEGSSWRNDKQQDLVLSGQQDLVLSGQQNNAESYCNELLPSSAHSSAGVITASPKDSHAYLEGDNGGIDLNTTPKQKPPKRRKHRPKVVIEGKPKRTPKVTIATPPTNITSSENPTRKRKYVRKKNLQASTAQPKSTTNELKNHDVQSATKSCRRALNFDLEEATDKIQDRVYYSQTKKHEESKEHFNLNLKFQDSECSAGINNENLTTDLLNEKQQGYSVLAKYIGTSSTQPSNKMLAGVSSPVSPAAATSTANNHTLNIMARNLSMRNSSRYQTSNQDVYNQGHQDILGGNIGRIVQTDTTPVDLDRTKHLLQSSHVLNVTGVLEQRGPKRAYCQSGELGHKENTVTNSQLLLREVADNNEYYVDSHNISIGDSEAYKKKKRASNTSGEVMTSLPSSATSRQMDSGVMHGVYSTNSTSEFRGLPDSYLGKGSTYLKLNNGTNQIPQRQHVEPMAVRHKFSKQNPSQVHLHKDQTDNSMSQPCTEISSLMTLGPLADWNLPSQLPEDPSLNALVPFGSWNPPATLKVTQPTQGHKMEIPNAELSTKRKNWSSTTSKKEANVGGRFSKHQNPSTAAGSLEQKIYLDSVDQIMDQLKGLHINSDSQKAVEKEQNALIPYVGAGSVVLYNSIKRRKPRPKVDLDPETHRLWNLLMGKEGSESAENMDKHTEKWWEEERKVFRGRIDSFIARMHLVQGDRRFSPWKGSVVDSVIGVFLTQNVSDHLSSSAFMSLVAKYPLLKTKEDCFHRRVDVIVEDPEGQTIELDGANTYPARILSRSIHYQSSATSSETSELRTEDLITGTILGKQSKRIEEETLSSQSSSNSIIYQAIEEAKSSSDSNSEVEDQAITCNFNTNRNPEELRNPMSLDHQTSQTGSSFMVREHWGQQPAYTTHSGLNPKTNGNCEAYESPSSISIRQNQGCTPSSNLTDLRELEAYCCELSGKGDISSLPLMVSNNRMEGGIDLSRQMTGNANRVLGQVTSTESIQDQKKAQPASRVHHCDSISLLNPITGGRCNQQSMEYNEERSLNQTDSTFRSEPMKLTEGPPSGPEIPKSTPRKPIPKTSTNISNARKRKVDGETKKIFDWDSLRKQVHSMGSRKERNKDTIDSLDYEVLRHADVRDISHTIRERGMNNMLAERMKDFLNRLVREHGSVDLEWLRDVPADKAKDYLLSIRGLGLKSVECVRLLTLHNVAFPVDTNVGRIAVRLGWVPLQPLPESLQLHLLELYPVLESIQKYLWPRLCKLDQRTLYELHYQMITFGKVFCTKSKPNCNACPMRGECRHFASAFASARLALPGPEEKSIVSSAPVAADIIPPVVIKPMPLPAADTYNFEDMGINRSNEFTVEEPKTPEPSIEALESDIEDAFYDDPDEIPTIKLNIEEFTSNLQTFMQGHMELQEGDFSKAIVALNPQMASIPTQKLKNINRLRTEHQVYELPDSHPLLIGLDRREPDDPSPYLLAIWTPGETANSIQPPESKCGNQALGGLCDERTCYSCNSIREANSQTVRGTLLIPCRTAMKGSFPLNGTYFQVNEMFADHKSSLNPIDVPRELIWNLPRRTVYFGTSVTNIFKGLNTEEIQFCFWRGFVCVRGFDQETRAPKPLMARLHFPASKLLKTKSEGNKQKAGLQKG